MEICFLKKEFEKEWDEYAFKHPDSTFYHLIGWKKVVENNYGHEPIYISAKEDNNIRGILPLFLMRSKVFGNKLVSVPFGPYGGICADDENIKHKLLVEAINIVHEKGLDFLELRDLKDYQNDKLITNKSYVTNYIDLEKEPQNVWEKIKRDRQRNINKAVKNGLKLNWSATIEDFYMIHSNTMRDMGTPYHDINFFRKILNEFPNHTKVLTVSFNGQLIGCQLLFIFKNVIIAAWGSSPDKYKNYYPDQFTVWEVIKYGCTNGYDHFDFGRCLCDTGAYGYKERWGGYSKQLYYQYYLNKSKMMPDTSQTNSKRKRFADIWRKMPIFMTDKLGPRIRKNIP